MFDSVQSTNFASGQHNSALTMDNHCLVLARLKSHLNDLRRSVLSQHLVTTETTDSVRLVQSHTAPSYVTLQNQFCALSHQIQLEVGFLNDLYMMIAFFDIILKTHIYPHFYDFTLPPFLFYPSVSPIRLPSLPDTKWSAFTMGEPTIPSSIAIPHSMY